MPFLETVSLKISGWGLLIPTSIPQKEVEQEASPMLLCKTTLVLHRASLSTAFLLCLSSSSGITVGKFKLKQCPLLEAHSFPKPLVI